MEMFLNWSRANRIATAAEVTKAALEDYQRYLFDYRKKDGQPLAIASQHSRLAHLVSMAERVLHPVGRYRVENKMTDPHFAMRGLLCASAVQSHKRKESRSSE
jgi:hypothetical protein